MHAEKIAREIANEFYRAQSKFPAFNSGHEGYAVILEEMDELWEEVKNNKRPTPEYRKAMQAEAIQVGAMALRFVHDLCVDSEAEWEAQNTIAQMAHDEMLNSQYLDNPKWGDQ